MTKQPASPIFDSKKRTDFFEKYNFPFFDASVKIDGKKIHYPYALYTIKLVDDEFVNETNKAAVAVAKVFDRVLTVIQSWNVEQYKEWGFPESYTQIAKLPQDKFFCLRVGWGLDANGELKVLEINSQTPAFWIEPEFGNPLLSEEFKVKNPHPNSKKYLKSAVNQSIIHSLESLPNTPTNPRVGFVTCDYYEDIDNCEWLASQCDFPYEVITIAELDFDGEEKPYSTKSGLSFDCIFLWYPFEWLIEDEFANGQPVFEVFQSALANKKFTLAHAASAFLIQPKSILAYITANADDIFIDDLKDARKYFLDTTIHSAPTSWKDYIVKPIWGREGRGCYIVKNGKPAVYGRYQEEYYTEQQMVYQELMNLPTIEIGGKKLSIQYESWAYRVKDEFKPGALGARVTEHLITDDYSYWLPLGVNDNL